MRTINVMPLGTVSPYPKDGKNCPGFLIKYADRNILFDCGNGCTRLLNMEKDLKNLTIMITHLHPDHYGDLLSLLQAIYVYRRYGYVKGEIDLYIPSSMEKRTEHYTDNDGWGCSRIVEDNTIDYYLIYKYANQAEVNVKEYDKCRKKYNYGDISLSSMLVPHQVESYALKFESDEGIVVYSGDTGTKNKLRDFAQAADLFVCESTFFKGQLRVEDAHLYAHEAAEIARDAFVKKLLLTHFWPELDKQLYLNEALEVFKNTEVAEEGKIVKVRSY